VVTFPDGAPEGLQDQLVNAKLIVRYIFVPEVTQEP
jgi:hypothetical protein